MYGQTKQLDTCTMYNVHVVALVITHSPTCTMQGWIQRGEHPARTPPKIGKNMIF